MVKLLIAEDEAGIRNSIISALYWEELGCELVGAAGSGLEALEMCLQYEPDIVLSDIVMSGIDGLTLLRYLKEKSKPTRFIILTGYRDFEYAKDALNLGADSFMLKPVKMDELENAIRDLAGAIEQERHGNQNALQVESYLRSMLCGRVTAVQGLPQLTETLRHLEHGYRVAVIAADGPSDTDHKRQHSLHAFCSGMLDTRSLVVRLDPPLLCILLPCSTAAAEPQAAMLQKLIDSVGENFRFTVSAGLSDWQTDLDSIHKTYLNASKAMSQKFFTGTGYVHIFPVSGLQTGDKSGKDPFLHLQKARDSLRCHSGVELTRLAGQLFDRLIQPYGNHIAAIKSTILVFLTLCIKEELSGDQRHLAILLQKYANFQRVVDSESLQMLRDIFVNVLLDLEDYVSVKKSSNKRQVIQRILAFIETNYDKSVSLQDLAQLVYLSPSYLSSFITGETGKTFVELLHEVRIQKAAELLRGSDERISAIARLVGFNEPQYFSVSFKKSTGFTPSEYRRQFEKEFAE